MNKRLVAFLCVAVALMLLVVGAFAKEWFCSDCGKSNEGNFCSNCGRKKPDEKVKADGIKNIQCRLEGNGDILVTWDDDSRTPPYTVEYEAEYNNGLVDSLNSRRATLEFLIPGESYIITVSNDESEAYAEYTVPVKVFTDFSESSKKIVVSETIFSISEAERDRTKQYEVQVHYPLLRQDRTYKGKLVTKTPFGYGGTVTIWRDFQMRRRYEYVYTDFSLYEFFDGIKLDFEDIPTGTYTYEQYFDGKLYSTCTFTVVP